MMPVKEDVQLLRLREHTSLTTTVLSAAQVNLLREQFGQYLRIAPTWDGAVEIRAKQYVGAIVLDDLQIVIEPKVPIKNLFYMLTYAYDLPEFRDEQRELTSSDELFRFTIKIFLQRVEQIVRRGIFRTYLDREGNERFLRGRLLTSRHIQRNAVRAERFYQELNEFTPDVLENQILKYTLWLLSRHEDTDSALKRELRRVLSAFSQVSLTPVTGSDCLSVVYTRINRYYKTVINLAHLLLQHLSLEGERGAHRFWTYMFDMNQLFELFVARFLKEALPEADPALDVEIQPEIWLDAGQKEHGIPDIVIRHHGERRLVLDTKYKDFAGQPSRGDRNQMVTYCYAMDVPGGILIYPNEEAVYHHSTYRDVEIRARNFPLAGDLASFKQHCDSFRDWLIRGGL